jgi:hypothetical protein
MPDPVADVLRTVQTSNRVRAAAWEAAYASDDPDQVAERLRALPIGDSARAKLWDARFAQPEAVSVRAATAAPAAPPNEARTQAPGQYVHEMLTNIPRDAWEQGTNIVSGTGQLLGTLARGTAEVGSDIGNFAREVVGLQPNYGGHENLRAIGGVPRAVAEHYGQYLDPNARAERVREHPVGTALDLIPVAGALKASAGPIANTAKKGVHGGAAVTRAIDTAIGIATKRVGATMAGLSGQGPVETARRGLSALLAGTDDAAHASASPVAPHAPTPVASAASASPAASTPAASASSVPSASRGSATTPPAPRGPSPQMIQNELGIQARRQGVKLTEPQYQAAERLVGRGASPAEAVREIASRVQSPSATPPVASTPEAPPSVAPPKKAPARPKLTADEADEYLRLLEKGETHQEAVRLLMDQRRLASMPGTVAPDEMRQRVARRLSRDNRTASEAPDAPQQNTPVPAAIPAKPAPVAEPVAAPPKAPVARQQKRPLKELIGELKVKAQERRVLAGQLAAPGEAVQLKAQHGGQTALAGPDMSKPGRFRLTRFDDGKPVGHTEHATLDEAIARGLDDGFQPQAPKPTPDPTPAPPVAKAPFDADAAAREIFRHHSDATLNQLVSGEGNTTARTRMFATEEIARRAAAAPKPPAPAAPEPPAPPAAKAPEAAPKVEPLTREEWLAQVGDPKATRAEAEGLMTEAQRLYDTIKGQLYTAAGAPRKQVPPEAHRVWDQVKALREQAGKIKDRAYAQERMYEDPGSHMRPETSLAGAKNFTSEFGRDEARAAAAREQWQASEAAKVTPAETTVTQKATKKPQTPAVAAEKVKAQVEKVIDLKGATSAADVQRRVIAALDEELASVKTSAGPEPQLHVQGEVGKGKEAYIMYEGQRVAHVDYKGRFQWTKGDGTTYQPGYRPKNVDSGNPLEKHDGPFSRTYSMMTQEGRKAVVNRVTFAAENARNSGMITVQIPGDGTFTIRRTPQAIQEVIDRMKAGGSRPWRGLIAGEKPLPKPKNNLPDAAFKDRPWTKWEGEQ